MTETSITSSVSVHALKNICSTDRLMKGVVCSSVVCGSIQEQGPRIARAPVATEASMHRTVRGHALRQRIVGSATYIVRGALCWDTAYGSTAMGHALRQRMVGSATYIGVNKAVNR